MDLRTAAPSIDGVTAANVEDHQRLPWVNRRLLSQEGESNLRRRLVEESLPLEQMSEEPRFEEPYLGLTTDMVEHHLRHEEWEGATTTFLATFAGRHVRLLPAPYPIHTGAGPEHISNDILRSVLLTDGVRGAIDLVCRAGRARGRECIDALSFSVADAGYSPSDLGSPHRISTRVKDERCGSCSKDCTRFISCGKCGCFLCLQCGQPRCRLCDGATLRKESRVTEHTRLPDDLEIVKVWEYLELLAHRLPHAACSDVAEAFGQESSAIGLVTVEEEVSPEGTNQGTIHSTPEIPLAFSEENSASYASPDGAPSRRKLFPVSPPPSVSRNDRGRELGHRRAQLRRRYESRAGRIIMDSSQWRAEGEVEFNMLHCHWRRAEVQLRREIALEILETTFLYLGAPFPGAESAESRLDWVRERFPFQEEALDLFDRDRVMFHRVLTAYKGTGKGSTIMSSSNIRLRSGIYFAALADAEASDEEVSSTDDTPKGDNDMNDSDEDPEGGDDEAGSQGQSGPNTTSPASTPNSSQSDGGNQVSPSAGDVTMASSSPSAVDSVFPLATNEEEPPPVVSALTHELEVITRLHSLVGDSAPLKSKKGFALHAAVSARLAESLNKYERLRAAQRQEDLGPDLISPPCATYDGGQQHYWTFLAAPESDPLHDYARCYPWGPWEGASDILDHWITVEQDYMATAPDLWHAFVRARRPSQRLMELAGEQLVAAYVESAQCQQSAVPFPVERSDHEAGTPRPTFIPSLEGDVVCSQCDGHSFLPNPDYKVDGDYHYEQLCLWLSVVPCQCRVPIVVLLPYVRSIWRRLMLGIQGQAMAIATSDIGMEALQEFWAPVHLNILPPVTRTEGQRLCLRRLTLKLLFPDKATPSPFGCYYPFWGQNITIGPDDVGVEYGGHQFVATDDAHSQYFGIPEMRLVDAEVLQWKCPIGARLFLLADSLSALFLRVSISGGPLYHETSFLSSKRYAPAQKHPFVPGGSKRYIPTPTDGTGSNLAIKEDRLHLRGGRVLKLLGGVGSLYRLEKRLLQAHRRQQAASEPDSDMYMFGARGPTTLFLRQENVCIELLLRGGFKGRVPALYHERGDLQREFDWGWYPELSGKERVRSLALRSLARTAMMPERKIPMTPSEDLLFEAETCHRGGRTIKVTFSGTPDERQDNLYSIRVWDGTTVRQLLNECWPFRDQGWDIDEAKMAYVRGLPVELDLTIKNLLLGPEEIVMLSDPALRPTKEAQQKSVQTIVHCPVLKGGWKVKWGWRTIDVPLACSIRNWLRQISLEAAIPVNELSLTMGGKTYGSWSDLNRTMGDIGIHKDCSLRVTCKCRGGAEVTPHPDTRNNRRRLDGSQYDDGSPATTFEATRVAYETEGTPAIEAFKLRILAMPKRNLNRLLARHGEDRSTSQLVSTLRQRLFDGFGLRVRGYPRKYAHKRVLAFRAPIET